MSEKLRVAMIVTDGRDDHGQWDRPAPFFGTAPSALIEGFEGLKDVELHIVSAVRRPVNAPERIAPNIFYHAVQIGRWSLLRSVYVGCVLAVRRVVRRIRPDIVHGQGTERYCSISAIHCGAPCVLTIHGNMRAVARALGEKLLSFHGITAWLEGWTIPRADGVICLSSYTTAQVAGLARRTWELPNAVQGRFFQEKGTAAKPPELACVGRICSYKNQNRLITALDPIAAKRDFRLVFAGPVSNGAYGAEFRNLLASRPWCVSAGNLDQEALMALYSRSTFGVHPTLEDNCPMVILEAAAAGVPYVASRIGGVPDLIEHGVTGLLFDPHNPADMAEKVASLLDDPSQVATMGAAARAGADRRFRPVVVAEEHVRIYREILGRAATSAAPS